ncbi:30S ribosomal protein S21 [Candidatus Sneabacter namystus]|uniref:Small ribosomal subunit protein bS21 n=1 Tax=Candidatus Sneabacter namystus TaxID=2601646 RepID=A0A5C0UKJ8_9RICK|nr:30S ribosomal protein S21 [Candidatus Sneabacter namystus]QEK39384.1 30S ribosomal protein S21 [Candidatus Sneabacter namystus]
MSKIVVGCSSNTDATLKILQKRLRQELRFSKMRERRHYESPSEKSRRRSAEASKRRRKTRFGRAPVISAI